MGTSFGQTLRATGGLVLWWSSSIRLDADAPCNDLPAPALLAPGPCVSVAAVADVPVERARQDRTHRHLGDQFVDVDTGVLEIESGEPKPSRSMRREIVLFSNDRAVWCGEHEILVEKLSERSDVIRQHRRSQALLGVADLVL